MFQTMLNSMTMLAIVMSLGYYLQKKDVLSDDVRGKLTYILLNISMPMTFFMSLQVDYTPELLQSAITIVLYSLLMHVFFLIIGYIITKVLKINNSEAGIVIFSLAFKNLTYIGLPVLISLFPDNKPAFYVSLFCIPFNVLSFSLGPKLLSSDENVKMKMSDFTTNINFSVLIGFIFFMFSIKVPSVVGNAFSTVSQLTIPLSLLLTGALLTKARLREIFKDVKVLIVSAINLIALPILFYIVLCVIKPDQFLGQFSVVMSLLPSASLTLILTDRYGGNVDFAGKIVLTTTLFSLFTAVLLSGYLIIK